MTLTLTPRPKKRSGLWSWAAVVAAVALGGAGITLAGASPPTLSATRATDRPSDGYCHVSASSDDCYTVTICPSAGR